ncbi:MAG: alpha/beta hydrolase [Burkholderiales bacterium]|nr:alpha/beta hydrolase [Burkholderiales bacterium]
MTTPYEPLRAARPRFLPLRGIRYHLHEWGDIATAAPERPLLVLLHGWMDVGASFQFMVDALARAEGFERAVVAPDWRGFGLSQGPATDSYWFPDYLGDLDALLDKLLEKAAPGAAVDLVGHSMGGNVAMSYAGVRPRRVRRLVNLEGYGMPATDPAQAPARLVRWLDELKSPQSMRDYDDLDAVAARLRANNPRLAADQAAWLAPHWSRLTPSGRRELLADAAHKRVNPVPYRVDETLAAWRLIAAPLLFVEGDASGPDATFRGRYPAAEFDARLAAVPRCERATLADAGHMLHHDQPAALAALLARFLA